MRDFPKHLNSKQDYLNVMAMFDKSQWAPAIQALLDTSKDYVFVKYLDEKVEEDKLEPDEKIVEVQNEIDSKEEFRENRAVPKFMLMKLQEIPTCKMNQLGFTREELEGFLQ